MNEIASGDVRTGLLGSATTYTEVDRVVDTVLRMLEATDFALAGELRAVFADEVVIDLSDVHPSVLTSGPYVGIDEAVASLMATVGAGMDTLHALTNVRTRVDGDTAVLTAYVSGQHHRPGEGASLETQVHLLLGNRMVIHLRTVAGEWLITGVQLSSRYSLGDASVTHAVTQAVTQSVR